MDASLRWPARLTLVRHAESLGNVARLTAESNDEHLIDIAARDMDVSLSDLGEQQAAAFGEWLDALGQAAPTVVYASPYERAASTARIAMESARLDVPLVLDERLREREFGVLDRLTKRGIEARFPDQAEARARVGKFYYRPPGGESWCDVALRVRSMVDTVSREHGGGRVLVVAHEVVIFVARYVLEHLSEAEVLRLGREHELANCSVTSYSFEAGRDGDGMRLECFNEVRPLEQHDAPVTHEPDVPRAPR
jgi:broad specificity phosphatase PhoE